MTIRISLLLPTRERPAMVERFFNNIVQQTTMLSEIEVVMYLDEDDRISQTLDYQKIAITKIVGSRQTMGGYLTDCLEKSKGELIVLVNDDIMIRTPGWDRILLQLYRSIEDRIFLAYGDDLFQGKKVCTFPVLSKHTCTLLQIPFPAVYQGAFIDTHLFDIFKRLKKLKCDRIRFIENLIFEHLHFRTGKSKIDKTYQLRDRFGDDDTFTDLRHFRQEQAEMLLATICQKVGAGPDVSTVNLSVLLEKAIQAKSRRTFTGNYVKAVIGYAKCYLMDGHLPFFWRLRLFIWFCGRNLARRGYLSWYEKFRDRRGRII